MKPRNVVIPITTGPRDPSPFPLLPSGTKDSLIVVRLMAHVSSFTNRKRPPKMTISCVCSKCTAVCIKRTEGDDAWFEVCDATSSFGTYRIHGDSSGLLGFSSSPSFGIQNMMMSLKT